MMLVLREPRERRTGIVFSRGGEGCPRWPLLEEAAEACGQAP